MDTKPKEKEQIVCKDLRTLAIKVTELSTRERVRLETPVYISIFPDGGVYIE